VLHLHRSEPARISISDRNRRVSTSADIPSIGKRDNEFYLEMDRHGCYKRAKFLAFELNESRSLRDETGFIAKAANEMNFCEYFIISSRDQSGRIPAEGRTISRTKRIHTVSIYEPISMVIRDSCSDEGSLSLSLSLPLPVRRGIFRRAARPGWRLAQREKREKREKKNPQRGDCAGARLLIKPPRSDSASANRFAAIVRPRSWKTLA